MDRVALARTGWLSLMNDCWLAHQIQFAHTRCRGAALASSQRCSPPALASPPASTPPSPQHAASERPRRPPPDASRPAPQRAQSDPFHRKEHSSTRY